MYITHQHYENSMSWANSYVRVFKTIEEAENEMYDTIYCCLAHCEKETMDKIVELLKDYYHKKKDYEYNTVIDWFSIENEAGYYYITDEYEEDEYKFKILDTECQELANDF